LMSRRLRGKGIDRFLEYMLDVYIIQWGWSVG